LAEALIWLHRPGAAAKSADAPVSLMTAYSSNGSTAWSMNYFLRRNHARNLRIFDETAKPDNARLTFPN